MRTIAVALAAVIVLAACSAAPGTTQQPTGQATASAPSGTATLPAATGTPPASAPPAGGTQTVSVTLTGGPDAGTYTGTDNPNCSLGLSGANTWGTQFSIIGAGQEQLSSFQLVAPEGGVPDPESMFGGTVFLMTVTIGPFEGTGSRAYEIAIYTEDSDKPTTGYGAADVTDNGATAVIHATGGTYDGVAIDATVTCPSVTRA